MKVLLCILTGQHMPNLLSVHHYKPDQLVLLETPYMKKGKVGVNFLDALGKGKLTFSSKCIYEVKNEDSIASVKQVLESTYQKYKDDEWLINLTGGTKPMSIALFEFFKDKDAKIIYVNNPKPDVFIDLQSENNEQGNYKPSIQEFLEGYGFEYAKSSAKIEEAQERAKRYFELSCLLAGHAKSEDLFTLNRDEHKNLREGKIGLRPQWYEHLSEEIRRSIVSTFTRQERSNGNKYMGEFLTGGWLEVFFWGLLKYHEKFLDLWDIRLGIEPRKKGMASGASNDLDVAFMQNYTMSFVECKSGSQNNDKDGDILYKIESVRKQLGALRVKSYLATTTTNILKDGRIKESFANRASLYDCTIITLDKIKDLAHDWQTPDTVKKIMEFK